MNYSFNRHVRSVYCQFGHVYRNRRSLQATAHQNKMKNILCINILIVQSALLLISISLPLDAIAVIANDHDPAANHSV